MSTSSRPLPSPVVLPSDTFQLGDASLTLSGDLPLRERFRIILGDCAASTPSPVNVDCDVASHGVMSFAYPGQRLDLARVLESVAETRDDDNVVWRVDEDRVAFEGDGEWRGLAANAAMNVAFAVQPDVFFFHAASVAIHVANNARGVMLTGAKGSGKSTLSLALAARNHNLLGDELAALRVASNELLPMRRAASIREGIRAAAIDARLGDIPAAEEKYPDGSRRLRIRISDLFPSSDPKPVPLRAIVFLRSFAKEPRMERFTPSFADSSLLQPIGSMWKDDGARRFRLIRLLSNVACFHLDAAAPEATAALIEDIIESVIPSEARELKLRNGSDEEILRSAQDDEATEDTCP
jgi:hypothetical protein